MGRLEGKVAFITGAARGQGHSHAIRLAEEGADIIAVDLCAQIDTVPYGMATPADLEETVKAVEALDRRIVAAQADVRDYGALKKALDDGVAQLGRLDIVAANAGIFPMGTITELTDQQWQDMIDVNLTGVWHAAKAAIPQLIEQATGGPIVLTSSAAGLEGMANIGHYVAAKHGVVGLVHPTTVNTDMIQNETRAASSLDPERQRQSPETDQRYRGVVYDAMVVTLSGRIFLDETVEATPEQVLRQIWEDHFFLQHSILEPAAAPPG